jgi:YD repeat-containing protein
MSKCVTVTATSPSGTPLANLPVALAIGGDNGQQLTANTTAAGQAIFTYTGLVPGTDGVQAVAWISGQPISSNLVTLSWLPPAVPPSTPPIATPGWIGSPANQSQVSGLVPIILASTVTLQSGTLDYWPTSNPSAVTTLAANVSGSGGTTLATLDTTTLANGSYIVRLQGTDTSNNKLNSQMLVTVVGVNKPGRVTFSVTDLTVPVTGLPITIGRTYDSLLKNQVGDFGNGWTLSLGSPQVSVDPAHNVTLTLPNGRRATFFFTPQSSGGVFGYLLTLGYTPEPGVYGSLTSDGCGLLVVSAGQYFCFLNGPYQPTTYTYTDPYGRAYVIDAASGALKSVTDLDGNILSFTAAGITSSAGGLSVPFVRDNQGRITRITDPLGNAYTYSYDASGNLASVALPGVATPITHTYDASHLLLTMTDPRGNQAVVTTYDSSGRMQSIKDAQGNTTSYSYNLSTHTTSITAPDGGVSAFTYDNSGMLVSLPDPLTHTTSYTYDSQHNLLTVTDPLNNTTTYTYDAQGNRLSATNPFGSMVSATYNRFSGPTTLTDAQGTTWTVSYDAFFHPASVSDSLGTLGSYTWDTHGQPLTRADANGKVTGSTYDQYGNLLT